MLGIDRFSEYISITRRPQALLLSPGNGSVRLSFRIVLFNLQLLDLILWINRAFLLRCTGHKFHISALEVSGQLSISDQHQHRFTTSSVAYRSSASSTTYGVRNEFIT